MLALTSTAGSVSAENRCESLTSQGTQPGVVLDFNTTFYDAGALVNISNSYTYIETSQLSAFCRVQVALSTNSSAADSIANTEVWLPELEEWNGRFLGVGNGGFAGGVAVGDLGYVAVKQGFAGVSTDTGHTSSSYDLTWGGPGNDNAIIDFSWRALHLRIEVGKQLVHNYYGSAAEKSYYLGCSTGGKQGLTEIQMFPDDFDGVVIGSPANWYNHLIAKGIHQDLYVLPENLPQWIPTDLWTGVIHDEVLRQCDDIDGVADGILNDPRLCQFQPEVLVCKPGQNTSTCLTLPQIEALHKFYSDYVETNQTYIFGGYYPGGEQGYPQANLGSAALEIFADYFKYFVLNDTDWDYTSFDYSTIKLSDELNVGGFDATSPNLTAFVNAPRNGKVIHYVGWSDQIISVKNSLRYYESVHAFMQSETGANVDDFYRLFTVPGMEHCYGGYGANAFGGAGQAAAGMPPPSDDAEHNILAALVEWVEKGTAPHSLVATYYNDNNASEGVGFTRPLCKYPMKTRHVGGDANSSNSFKCSFP